MTRLPLLEDLGDLRGRSVLVRVDFNVPMAGGEIADDMRIRAALPTLRWLRDRAASVTAITHLGRPRPAWHAGGSGDAGPDPGFSVAPIRRRLAELVPGVELAENLRLHPGEIAGDADFAARLARGHDAYVNDAFGVSHRAHASVVGLPRLLPAAAGRLLAREVEVLGGLRVSPRRPFVAVLGGSKVSGKLGVIEALLSVADSMLIGGAMCFALLEARGRSVGVSRSEDAMVERCRALLRDHGGIHLPCDVTSVSPGGIPGDPSAGGEVRRTGPDLPDGWTGADIGPASAAAFADVIRRAGTVLWNGPMGVFEDPRFAHGTRAVAEAMATTRAFTVVGGGESAAAVRELVLDGRMDHVSTGGGASLELVGKGDLPGLAALRSASVRGTVGCRV